MNAFRTTNEWTRLTALTILGKSTPLFHSLAKYGSGSATLVNQNTELCIEAPPRSANSFLFKGFSMANPEVSVAHHHHVPAQVHRALELGVPVVTLLRNPIDSALAKAAPTDELFLLGTTLRRWISFWHGVDEVMGTILVARFEDVIQRPSSVIRAINAKWDCDFSSDFPPTASVFEAMEEQRVSDQGAMAAERPNPNIPNDEIKKQEKALRSRALNHPAAAKALTTYESIIAELPELR